ncbi:extracellular solute-binding protein [Paenibacillus alkalitolerans]|uniref:extracellular solute-binding protein n=1 Tax=Paenibacillus alkalitolerans TaxID=2799335 RepID=UPI0018F78D80|nr:extracellular solute-binding protein [Paenibacillus alkalitolerans]
MKNVKLKKLLWLAAILLLGADSIPVTNLALALGDSTSDGASKDNITLNSFNRNSYFNYLSKYKDAPLPQDQIVIKGTSYINNEGATTEKLSSFQDTNDVLAWKGEEGTLTWSLDIKETGFYNIGIRYLPLSSGNEKIELQMKVDSSLPFDEAGRLSLEKPWKDTSSDMMYDQRGNSIRPRQEMSEEWIEADFKDREGLYNEPFRIYFEKGKHTLELTANRSDFILDYIKIYNHPEIEMYQSVVSGYKNKGYKAAGGGMIKVQAENIYRRSDSILTAQYDRSGKAVEPSHPTKMLINIAGGQNWQYQGQWLKWKVDVKESGLYSIAFKARQNYKSGLFSNRRLYIDGKMPFQEAAAIKFPYQSNWYMKVVGDENPYQFYLEEGAHEITLEVVPGEFSETITVLENALYYLNKIYREIITITGTSIDVNRDYNLDSEIPGLMDEIIRVNDLIKREKERLVNISGSSGNETAILDRLSLQMATFIDKPETIPARLDKYKGNVDALAAWLLSLKQQPLDLDYIVFIPEGTMPPKANAGFFENMVFRIQALIGSFSEDYGIIGDLKTDQALTVWVGMGRDQVQIVKQLVDDYFTPSTGIQVNVNLVQQGIMEAVLAGSGPDVVLFVNSGDAVNLAMRGAIANVDQFDGFNEVTGRFIQQAMVPYEFNGHYYGIPLTQTFPMMFYRKDIFKELNLSVPQTWDEMFRVIPVIQRKNMSVGIPPSSNVNVGSSISNSTLSGEQLSQSPVQTNIFGTILYQRGGRYYNDDKSSTEFDKKVALEAFRQYTSLFSDYSLPLMFDFYNRFRSGEMPLGIAEFTEYNRLQAAAPEIRNLWEMVPVPGTKREDGTIDHTVLAGGQGSIILRDATDREAAWQFVEWFSSEDIQASFGRQTEAFLGPAGRYPTANLKAFEKLPWLKKERQLLLDQWENVKEIPRVPGDYYVERNLDHVFRRVVIKGENTRDSLYNYNLEMNLEIDRKRKEFGLE